MSPRPVRDDGTSFEACLDLARQGRHRDAVRDLTRALGDSRPHPQLQARAVEVLMRISRTAEAAGQLGDAELALVEALRVSPGYADVHYRLACVRIAVHKRAEARQSLVEALRLNPRFVAARVELALVDAREGRLGEALEVLRRLGQEMRVDEPRLFGQGLQSLEHADWEEAGTLLKHALHLDDPGMGEMIQEFHARMSRGDRAGAARLVRGALSEHEGFADLHYLLGTAELEESNLDDAISSFARALELHPDYHSARVQLARAFEALGDVRQAEEQVALVLQADPRHSQALELKERWSRLRRRRRGSEARAGEPRVVREKP